MAVPLITASLSDKDYEVRKESAEAIVKIAGSQAINSLVNYMLVFSSPPDQEAAKSALMTVMGSEKIKFLIPVLKEGKPAAKKSAIELLAWNKDNKYFSEVIPYVSFPDETVKAAAVKALSSLAGSTDQDKLIEIIAVTDNQEYITDLQTALATASSKISEPEKRSDLLIKYMLNDPYKRDASKLYDLKKKLIPVLAKAGGREALAIVLKEFENGDPGMRDVCFRVIIQLHQHCLKFVRPVIRLLKVRLLTAM
jgi:HEAT repeat protein